MQLNSKQILIIIILLVLTFPFLLKLLSWTTGAVINPSPDKIDEAVDIFNNDALPWWENIYFWLLSGGFLSILMIILIILIVISMKKVK